MDEGGEGSEGSEGSEGHKSEVSPGLQGDGMDQAGAWQGDWH